MSDLIKVTYDYSDGTKKTLEGQELDKWRSFNALVAEHASNHGMNPPWEDIKWNKIRNINQKIKDES